MRRTTRGGLQEWVWPHFLTQRVPSYCLTMGAGGAKGEGPHSCVWSSLSYKTGKPFLKAPLAQGVFSSPKIVFMCRPYLADPALARVLG